MNFCPECGAPVRLVVPPGDDRERSVCSRCGLVHYQNPKIIAGCLPVWDRRLLLCRRAIEPRLGFWTLPAGFMELGESLPDAARREAREEANIEVRIGELYTLYSLPHISQVYAFFRADMLTETHFPGLESQETRLFQPDEIPWNQLSFATVRRTLEAFVADLNSGTFPLRVDTIEPPGPQIPDN